jgi:predicted  nucleic acid-binding Zn-ribbon protein
MAKGIRRTWEILIDLIPKIYDTERSVRILGADGAEKYSKVNAIDPATGQAINDLSRGKYDVAITVGPSYATQRQEAVEAYTQIGQAQPELYGIAGDIIFRNMDLPGAEQIAERMKAMLPPAIQQTLQDGKPMPPEVTQAMQQVQQMQQQVQQHGQLVQQAAAEVEQKSGELDQQVAQLKVQQAQFDADVAKKLASIATAEAALVLKEAQSTAGQQAQEMGNERQTLAADLQTAVADIQKQAAEYMQHAAEVINNIHVAQQPAVHVHEQPKPRIVAISRVNGKLIPEYEQPSQVMQ